MVCGLVALTLRCCCRQDILASCVTELIDRKLIGLEGSNESLSGDRDSTTSVKAQYLRAIADKTEVHDEFCPSLVLVVALPLPNIFQGYSGRALRKLPVKAFAQVVGREKVSVSHLVCEGNVMELIDHFLSQLPVEEYLAVLLETVA